MRFDRDDAKVGLLVIGSLLLFGSLLFQRSFSALFKKEQIVKARFQDVSDLTIGTGVHLQGLRIGHVNKIELVEKDQQFSFLATLSLRPDIPLWKGTQLALNTRILGGSVLELKFPIETDRTHGLEEDAILESTQSSSLNTLLAQLQDTVSNFNGLITDLRGPIERQGPSAFLDHPDLRTGFKNLNTTLVALQSLIAQGQTTVTNLDQELSSSLKHLRGVLEPMEGLMTRQGPELEVAIDTLNRTLQDMEKLSQETRQMIGEVGPESSKALEALNRNLESTEELLEILKQKPSRVVWGTPKAKEIEAAKERVKENRKKQ